MLLLTQAIPQVKVSGDVKEFAERSLNNYLRDVITKENYTTFGFKNFDEISSSRLSDPYKVYFVRLDNLQDFETNQDPSSIITGTNKLWFPVEINQSTRLKMEVIVRDGDFIAGEFGASRTSQIIGESANQLQEGIRSRNLTGIKEIGLLQVPSLNVMMFYIQKEDESYFVPIIVDSMELGLNSGEFYTGNEVFAKLSEYSKNINKDIIR